MTVRVLLTRAADDAERTRATLEGLGHRVLISPVIAVEATGAAWPGGAVDALMATSGQAFVAIGTDWGPTPEARRLVPMWLVGRRTEEAARARGFLGPTYVGPNAVSLAFEMGKRRGSGRIVYLAGRDRKPDIEMALTVTEQKVEVVEVYEAKSVDHLDEQAVKALADGTLDAVLHFSRRSATLFANLMRHAGLSTSALHLCLSEDVAAPLADAGWSVRIAAEATEPSLIEALAAA